MSRRPKQRRSVSRLVAGCVVLFVALVAGGMWLIELDLRQREASDAQLVYAEVASLQAQVQEELYGSLHLATGLRAFVTAHPGLGDPDRLDVLLATLLEQGEHVRHVAFAPGNVVTVVHPLEGNEEILGVDYEDIPMQFGQVRQAQLTGETVLAGPIELVQGGTGLINRTPVFTEDGLYWGVINLVIDIDSLMAAVRERSVDTNLTWALRTQSQYGPGKLIAGDASLFDAPGATTTRFEVPNGTWELVGAGPAPAGATTREVVLRVVVVVLAAVVSLLVFELGRERWRVLAMSLHDSLTGLPNRRLLEDRIERAVAHGERHDSPFVLLFVDLDGFKPVNDSHGHRAGDHLLRELAGRMRARLRSVDTVARVGGDEFVVLMTDATPARAQSLAAELSETIARPVLWDDTELQVTASIGIAAYPTHGRDPSGLLQAADTAMYEIKHRATVDA